MDERRTRTQRIAGITEWLKQGLEISVRFPTIKGQPFLARIDEFGIIAKGDSADVAIEAAMDSLTSYLATLINTDEPLPDRREWLAKYCKASEGGDG